MKKIVLIGGHGFIGLHLIKQLVGHEIIVIDPHRLTDEETMFLSEQIAFEDAEFVPSVPGFVYGHIAHINNTFSPSFFDEYEAARDADVVVSLAGMLGSMPSVEQPVWCVSQSIVSHISVLATLARNGLKPLVVFPSSDLTYVVRKGNPRCLYTACKLFVENALSIFRDVYGIPYVALRMATGYGPMQRRPSVVNFYVQRGLEGKTIPVWGDGKNRQAFIYADDMARAFAMACEGTFGEGVFPLIGHNSSIIEIATTVEKLVGGRVVHEDFPEMAKKVNVGDLPVYGNPPGFQPKVGLEEGILKTAEWMKGTLE